MIATLFVFILSILSRLFTSEFYSIILLFFLFACATLYFYKAFDTHQEIKLFRHTSRAGAFICTLYLLLTLSLYAIKSPIPISKAVVIWTSALSENLTTFLTITIVPVGEELFFRQALLSFIFIKMKVRCDTSLKASAWSVYISALIFWIFHIPLQWEQWTTAWHLGGLPLGPGPFFLGIVCGGIALRDKSLFWPIVLHSMANGFGFFWAEILKDSNLLSLFYSLSK